MNSGCSTKMSETKMFSFQFLRNLISCQPYIKSMASFPQNRSDNSACNSVNFVVDKHICFKTNRHYRIGVCPGFNSHGSVTLFHKYYFPMMH